MERMNTTRRRLGVLAVLAMVPMLIVSCSPRPHTEITPPPGPFYEKGINHGKQVAIGLEKDFEIVIYIHDNIIGDGMRVKDFGEGFLAGYAENTPEMGLVAEEALALAMDAASSLEFDHGVEIARRVSTGSLTDTTARVTLLAPRTIVDDLALQAGFIKGYRQGGEAMYNALIR